MKITIYELLRLFEEDKAPEKIKYEYSIYELTPERNDYYCKDEMRWLTNEINSLGVLNDEVEIIEKLNKIEKIEMCTNGIMGFDGIENITTELKDKINELIDEINNLKEKI